MFVSERQLLLPSDTWGVVGEGAPIYNLNLTDIPQCYQLPGPVLGTGDGGQSDSWVWRSYGAPVSGQRAERGGGAWHCPLALGKGEVPLVQQRQTGLSVSGMKLGLDINLPLTV